MAISGAMVDPYATLNVPTTAPTAAIRSSYKRLMLQCHPDKVHDEALRAEKAAQFEKVQEAYELLIDPRRRRKYDEEMQRSGSTAAATASAGPAPGPAPPTARRSNSGPMGAASAEDEQTRERERAARHERRRRKAEERGSKGESGFNTPEDQHARAEARRWAQEAEAASRAREAERQAKYTQAREDTRRQEEARTRKSHTSARYAHGTGSSVDDIGTSPRKASTFVPPPSSYPKPQAPPPPPPRESKHSSQAPPQPAEPNVRPGYEETLREEQERVEAARQKMRNELGGLGGHSPHTGHSSRPSQEEFLFQQQAAARAEMQRAAAAQAQAQAQAQAAQAEMHRAAESERIRLAEQIRLDSERASRLEEEKRQQQQKEQQRREKAAKKEERERERERARQESERRQNLFRNADISSPSPPNRRSSHSTASRDDSSTFPTPQRGLHIPSSAPFGPTTPIHNLRRRHSISESPSLEKQQEKQQARMPRERPAVPTTPAAAYGQTGNCDSGYSSPSPDTTASTPEKKMMPQNPIVRNGADGAHDSTPWKKYTFEVYVREDEANPANTPQHPHSRRKHSSSGSPSLHPQEIPHSSPRSTGPPLPPDFFTKTTGIQGTPFVYPIHNAAHHPSSSVGGVPIENPFAAGSPGSYTPSRGPPSHTSSTGSTNSPRMGRQHSHHRHDHYSASPKSSSEAFTPHAGSTGPIPMPRSSTYSHPPSSGSRQRTDIYNGPGAFPHPPSFGRSGTWA